MIGLEQNQTIYDYDIRSLILEFFPFEKIEISINGFSKYDYYLKAEFSKEEAALFWYCKGNQIESALCPGNSFQKDAFHHKFQRTLLMLLESVTGQTASWGILTGIRPTKIIYRCMKDGWNDSQILNHLSKEYLISNNKSNLCLETVKNEINCLKNHPNLNGWSLYIGIPFCPSICSYCSFASYAIDSHKELIPEYLNALDQELSWVSKEYDGRPPFTIYIGGGTPTSLDADSMKQLFAIISRYIDLDKVHEITGEAGRPDSITKEKLKVLMDAGVTRISINPQTMNDSTLKTIGRNHSADDIKTAFYLARDLGFTNINMDMICGLPKEVHDDVKNTLREIEQMNPDSLTVHALAVKRSARLKEQRKQFHFGATAAMIDEARTSALRMDMHPYYLYRQKNIPGAFENTGFAKNGKECLYNILIMEELHDIIAIGAGASSKIMDHAGHITRVENVKDVRQYITRTSEMIQRKQKAFWRGNYGSHLR